MDNIKHFLFLFLFIIILVKIVVLPVNEFFILPNYLEYKAKNIKNIKKGYACYKGKYKTRSGNYVYEYVVDNTGMTSFSGLKVRFPFLYKRGEFFKKIENNSQKCIDVNYVEINYFFIKKKYIYDFI
ncbi:hypothetical protein AS4_08240 [Acinetobacter guillouiae]|uniref:hypothetical protein n=1 Tax=Acinetobacter guillouiae TaxID=106649 RepID=UPI0004EF6001|nr:hypothetical protein [Acinetobacter guillouiae]BAP35764.1 hypothetical protein AS4_08240 [Acinetobacter guillouiae]